MEIHMVDEENMANSDDAVRQWPIAVERLWAMLRNPDGNWVYERPQDAVEELVAKGQVAAERILQDVEEAVRVEYDNTGKFEGVSVNFGLLGGKDKVRRIQSVLRQIGGKAAREARTLLCLIDNLDDTVWFERTYNKPDTPEAIHVLTRRLPSPSPAVVEAAVTALRLYWAKLADKDLPVILALLTGNSSHNTILAANALGRIKADAAVEPLIALLSSNNPAYDEENEWNETVQSAAAQALGRIGDHRALDALVSAIGTYDDWTSVAAIDAVVALGGDSRAVIPILQASLHVEDNNRDWYYDERIDAVQKMGPQSFDALLDATANPDDLVRSLALWALAKIIVAGNAEAAEWRERAATCLSDPSASVRISAIELLRRTNCDLLAQCLLPLLDDDDESELGEWFCRGDASTVGEAAAAALPDDDAALASLRQALVSGSLDPIKAWVSFLDLNNYDKQKRGSARHAEVLVSCILERAKHGDEEAINALGYPAITSVLERLGGAYLDEAEEVINAFEQEENCGQQPLRWLYQVGSEFRDMGGDVWKIVRRIPETDAWHSLIFDVTHRASKAVRKNTRQSWWNMSVVASLIPVEPGTFERMTRTFEEQKAQEARVAALKARHGTDPRLVSLPEIATVQQFADVIGVPTAEVQRSARMHGKLLGHRERIAPDLLKALSDNFNVISASEGTVP